MLDREQYRLIVESSPNMIWRSDRSAACDYFNHTWLEFTGKTMEQEIGYGWAQGVHPADFDRCVAIYTENFNAHTPFEMNYRLKRHDGVYRWINDRGVPFYSDAVEFMGYIGSCMDITEKVEGQLLMDMAHYDGLCNIPNRQYAFELLHAAFAQAFPGKAMLSVLMLDIDDFKQVNDSWGHASGDSVLAAVAEKIKQGIRAGDICGRYGGDEFIVGVLNAPPDEAVKVAGRIQQSISAHSFSLPEGTFRVSVSIGIGSLDREPTLDALVRTADMNLYHAKSEGKGGIRGPGFPGPLV